MLSVIKLKVILMSFIMPRVIKLIVHMSNVNNLSEIKRIKTN